MLTIAGYIKTLKKYANDDSISNEDFFHLVFDTIINNLKIYNRRGREYGLYDFSKGSISDLLNCKMDISKTVRRPICDPENKDKLHTFFPELLKKCVDERYMAEARQELLVLARADERCRPFVDKYTRMNNTEFFVATFVDAINGQNVQGPEWRICSALETGKDALELSDQIMLNDQSLYKELPSECTGTREQWADMFRRFPECNRFLINRNGDICGNFSFIALSPQQEKHMWKGTLVDSAIKMSECPVLEKGSYSIYLLNLSINAGVPVEQYTRLWDTFFAIIKDFAQKDILISKVYYKAFLPEHEAKMLGRGFCYHKDDKIYGKIYIREIIDNTSDSPYDESESLSFANKMEAEAAYLNLFREVDELFINPRLCQLKPYFYSGIDIPESHRDYALGLAVAEFIRDAEQYASSLLDFLPEYRKKSHEQFEAVLQQSSLIQHSKAQYTFATEDPEHIASQLEQTASSPIAIVKFASIWLDIDKLFMQEDLIHLRPYFYDQQDKLPGREQDLELGIGLAVRIMSGLIIAEDMLANIPQAFVISFYEYKKMMWRARIIQEAAARYPFLVRELRF